MRAAAILKSAGRAADAADLLIDAGFPGGRFETMSFLYRTQKPNSSC